MNRQVESELTQSLWRKIGAHLENKKKEIYEQIKNYPPPIPACDLQFNHLLEERDMIDRELRRLHELADERPARADASELIDEFVHSSNFLTDESQRQILNSLKEEIQD